MPEKAQERGSRIAVRDEASCRYWRRQFGVRPRDLKRAARAVGNEPDAVKIYFDMLNTVPIPGPLQ